MIESCPGGAPILQFESLVGQPGLVHAVTIGERNYAPHRGIGCEQAMDWRRQLCAGLGLDWTQLTSPSQVHGGDSLVVEPSDIGRGHDGRGSAIPHVDGLLCNIPGVPLILMSADCPLVCAYDPIRRAIGAVHASWKGTVAGAAGQMVRLMQRHFGSRPEDLLAAIAPSAGPCCYEVGQDVLRVARTRLDDADACFVEREGRLFFDLWTANTRQLTASGVPADRIGVAGLCTICDRRFWSHRRDGEPAGRFALLISLT